MEEYSVLMSVYCKEKPDYLEESIYSMLNQTVPPADFVIVCDGPLTHELDCVIERFKSENEELFRIIRLPENRGLGEALRIGTEKCRYDIIARMDSDDIAVKNRMELQLAFLNENEDISVVGGQICEFFETLDTDDSSCKCRSVPTSSEEVEKLAAYRNPMNHMTVTFRKKAVEAAGGYMGFDKFEDYYLWARMLSKGYRLANIENICVYARVNSDMYRRRGGWHYFCQAYKLEKYLKNEKICTFVQFVRNVIIRFCGAVLVPNFFRRYLYINLLRNDK